MFGVGRGKGRMVPLYIRKLFAHIPSLMEKSCWISPVVVKAHLPAPAAAHGPAPGKASEGAAMWNGRSGPVCHCRAAKLDPCCSEGDDPTLREKESGSRSNMPG